MIMLRRVPFLPLAILPYLIGILLLITPVCLFAGSGAAMPSSGGESYVAAGTNSSQTNVTNNANTLTAESGQHEQKAKSIENSPNPGPAALAQADDERDRARLLANQAQLLRDRVTASNGPEREFLQDSNAQVTSFTIAPINFSQSDSLSGFMDNINQFSSTSSDAPGYTYTPSIDYATSSSASASSFDPVANMHIQPAYDVPFQQETVLAQQIENQWQQYSPYVPPQASSETSKPSVEVQIVPQKEPPVVAAVTPIRPESISTPEQSEPVSVGYSVVVEPKALPVPLLQAEPVTQPGTQQQTVVASAPVDAPVGSSLPVTAESTDALPLPQPPLVLPRTESAMTVMSMPLEQYMSPQGTPMNVFFYNTQLNAKAMQEYYASLDNGYRTRTPAPEGRMAVADTGVRFLPVNYLNAHEVELRIYNDIIEYTADTMAKEITYDGSWKTVASLQINETSIRRYLAKLLEVVGEISITKTIFENSENEAMEVYYLNLYKVGQKDLIMYVHNDHIIGIKLVTREDNITTAPIYIQAQDSIPSVLLKDSFAFAAQYRSAVTFVQPLPLFSAELLAADSSMEADRLLFSLKQRNTFPRAFSFELIPLPYLLRYSQTVQVHTLLKGDHFAGTASLSTKAAGVLKSPYSLYTEQLAPGIDENTIPLRPSILLF